MPLALRGRVSGIKQQSGQWVGIAAFSLLAACSPDGPSGPAFSAD